MSDLLIQAGPKAYRHIQQHGLRAKDIGAIIGASGAVKWLAIYGLDCAIFGQWLKNELTAEDKPIALYGTSIGAWKLAAAAQNDPVAAMTALAESYIDQSYAKGVTPAEIAANAIKMLDRFLPEQAVDEILQQPNLHYSLGTIRCHGLLGSDSVKKQLLGMIAGYLKNVVGYQALHSSMDRVIFHDQRYQPAFGSDYGFAHHHVKLTGDNFRQALLASGSIPCVLPGVANIKGAPKGVYRDGGLLDYHPALKFLDACDQRLVLYPHFYSHLTPCWFDKPLKHRRANGKVLDNVILLSPTKKFVEKLPYSKIPDRQDFRHFQGRDDQRKAYWREAMEASKRLGSAFLELQQESDILRYIKLID
ncbi:patatin-like phospholipase family protein [Pelagibaculum spongiae]|uniref:PNPLA domain-containing protein n=1 Tax=Pelagibaculum spongiae TaxID=2080658 RepID=A0A2V1GYR1_9GAMM|nr:patatin-like phospholipase family protein [Pelagibaculum spongiae]PVZ68125.1 hypothetical protein DC094_12525 [Pelagibaculum spongiae]